MSMRAALLAAVIAGVVCPPLAAEARAETVAKVTKQKASAKQKQKQKKKKKKKKKKKTSKKKERVSRTPSKSSLRDIKNMPRGYAWPPTRQMLHAERACRAKLDELGVPYKPAKAEGRIVSAMTVANDDGAMVLGGITYRSAYRKGPHKLDCQLALALETFGPRLHELGVREVSFGSIFRWTNVRVNGQTKNILSRHALGIAMDIVSFTDDTGRVATVKQDYHADDALLRSIEEAVNASGRFRTVLTPANDPVSHSDHFHIEVFVDYTAPAS